MRNFTAPDDQVATIHPVVWPLLSILANLLIPNADHLPIEVQVARFELPRRIIGDRTGPVLLLNNPVQNKST